MRNFICWIFCFTPPPQGKAYSCCLNAHLVSPTVYLLLYLQHRKLEYNDLTREALMKAEKGTMFTIHFDEFSWSIFYQQQTVGIKWSFTKNVYVYIIKTLRFNDFSRTSLNLLHSIINWMIIQQPPAWFTRASLTGDEPFSSIIPLKWFYLIYYRII